MEQQISKEITIAEICRCLVEQYYARAKAIDEELIKLSKHKKNIKVWFNAAILSSEYVNIFNTQIFPEAIKFIEVNKL